MEKVREMQNQFRRSKLLPGMLIGLTLAVIAGTILAGCLRLRGQVRAQIAGRDGETLYAVARWKQLYSDELGEPAESPITDPARQFNLILRISQLKGVLGIRLFTPDGAFTGDAFPATITDAALTTGDLAQLKTLKPVSHFYPAAQLASLDMLAGLENPNQHTPVLEVNLPLHAGATGPLAGVAQFIIQGDSIASEYADLDRHLILQGGTAFVVSGGVLALALALAFRAVSRQTERLLRANQELLLAAKTSAVGAVTSHLIHGLKNPLSGLQGFVKGQLSGDGTGTDTDWRDAMDTTQRMQALIGGVARILEEQQTAENYEISLRELVEIISARMLPVARSAGVHFFSKLTAEGTLTNREANLAILILENLIQNALQATPEGKSVRLNVSRSAEGIQCGVQDEGPGLAAELAARLFTPCRSTKKGGSGIGLAISKQLAMQIGAFLELKSNSPGGCVFELTLPRKIVAGDDLMSRVTTGE
jgi:signal transduction histidine kinase